MSESAPAPAAAPVAQVHIDATRKRRRRVPKMPDYIAQRSSTETGCHVSQGHRWVSREAIEDDR